MTGTTLDRPTPRHRVLVLPTAGLRRVVRARESTPGRLRLLMALLVGLGLAAGATVAVAASSTSSGTHEVGTRIEPLLGYAEAIDSSLADADATAAQAFLSGGLEPPALTERYNDDLRRANTALAQAAGLAQPGGATAAAVTQLSAGVSEYAGLVATARANNRQGFPVGASYLSAASRLNRTQLLPQAQALFQSAQSELSSGYGSARGNVSVATTMLLLLALLAGLIAVQRHLSRITHRTFNVPLVAATVLTLVLGGWVAGSFAVQRQHLQAAQTRGSVPIDTLAQARIKVLQERSDEGLTLVARGSGGAYETDFAAVSKQLGGTGGVLDQAASQVTGADRAAVRSAAEQHRAYLARHTALRALDDQGDYTAAVASAISPETSDTFASVTDQLARVLATRTATFATEIAAAGRGLGLLALLGPVLALVICALAAVGVRARLEEYR